jgi:hypothetical protein
VNRHVDLVSRHSSLHQRVSKVQCLSCQHGHFPQFDDFLWAIDLYILLELAFLLLFGDRREVVVGLGDVLGYW